MADSVVAICNTALDLLGADAITSIDDDNKQGRLCNRNYAKVRDAVLRAYPWNCAIARASLPALGDAPAFEFDRQFALPEGPDPAYCLRVLSIDGEVEFGLRYKIEGRRILTSEAAPLDIIYISRITDPALFDPLLADAISARLALDLAYPLTGSASLGQSMSEVYNQKLGEARAVDAQEGTPDEFTAPGWLESRL